MFGALNFLGRMGVWAGVARERGSTGRRIMSSFSNDLKSARPGVKMLLPGGDCLSPGSELWKAKSNQIMAHRLVDGASGVLWHCDVAGPGQGLSGDFYLVTQKLRKSYEIRKFSSCAKIAPKLPKIKEIYTKNTLQRYFCVNFLYFW